MLSIAISNAQPERTTSDANCDKTKKRNRMKPSTSSNLLLAREAVNDLTIDGKFEPTKSMIDRLIEGHYYDDLSD